MTSPTQHQDKPVFEPETMAMLSQAIDDTCEVLHIGVDNAHDRQIVAARIVDLARAGLVDVIALRNRVLQESRSAI